MILPPRRNAYWSGGTSSSETKEAEYPETKTPVPKRKSNPIEAPKTSKSFPGLTAKRCGSGGLKLGGAVNTTGSLDLVETEAESEGSEEALTMIRVLRVDLLRDEETGR